MKGRMKNEKRGERQKDKEQWRILDT